MRLCRAVRVIGQGAARLGVSCAVRSGDPDLSVNMGTLVNSLLLLRRLIVIAKITLNTNNTIWARNVTMLFLNVFVR